MDQLERRVAHDHIAAGNEKEEAEDASEDHFIEGRTYK